ncbi:MAG: hypothetical protein OCU12_05510 [Methanophagales archaeon]|nr:hypothetical protein [Methanophagales archaeon]
MSNSKILITVDTEVGEKAKHVKEGFEKFVLGKIGSHYYGIPKIVEILDRFDFKAEFFVDVYEYKFFGERKYKDLCKFLHENVHGVQLHTHPSYAYDPNRINMYEYSLEEQSKIISEGKELIEKWIGKSPIAHRAGNYGANNNTLTALKENNIKIDSSFFYKQNNCKIQLSTINEPIFYNGVLEVPVTVIKKYPKLFRIPVPFKSNWAKLDINWLSKKKLNKSILSLSNKCKYIILFLHSFSFINYDYLNYIFFEKDPNTLEKFINVLEFIKKSKIETILFKDLKELDIF